MTIPAKLPSRPRVLIVAFACHPDVNMETRIGWNRAIASSRDYDTTVVHSAEYSSAELASKAASLGIPAATIKFVAVRSWMIWMPLPCDAFYWVGYRVWHDAALKVAASIHENQPFQLVHLVSYCGYREPGQWWKLGIPFIWGPVGGTQNFPGGFLRKLSFGSSIREAIRNCMNDWQLCHSGRVRLAAQKAHTVFAASSQAQNDMLRGTGVSCTRLLETGVLPITTRPCRQLDTARPFRILWSGRLREWKALPLLFEALAALPPDVKFELRVMGVGTSEKRWRKIAERLKVSEHVQWIGWPSYNDGLMQYSWADAFAFTSLRDTSGTGLLESLAAGTPIIGLNHQGARDIMTQKCGIAVSVESPRLAIDGFKAALTQLARDPELWHRLSEGAVDRACSFSWDRLSDEIDVAYQAAIGPGEHAVENWEEKRGDSISSHSTQSSSRQLAVMHQSLE